MTESNKKWRKYTNPTDSIAQSLMQQGMSNAPVTDWAGGLNRVLQALGGAYLGFKGSKDNDKVAEAMSGKLGISADEASFLGPDVIRDLYADKISPSSPESFGTTPYMGADQKSYVRGNRGTVKEAMEGLLPKIDDLPTSVQEYQYGQQDPGFLASQQRAQAMEREITPYQQQSLDMKQQGLQQAMALGQQKLAQSGQMNPYQEQSLDLQRQRLAQGGEASMELLPVSEALNAGFPKGAVVQKNTRTGAKSVLYKPEVPAAATGRAPLATTASDVDLARSFMMGEGSGLRSKSGATPSDLLPDEQAILARHVADLGRGVQARGGTFPGAVQQIVGAQARAGVAPSSRPMGMAGSRSQGMVAKSRVDTIPLDKLADMKESDFSPAERARALARLRSGGYGGR